MGAFVLALDFNEETGQALEKELKGKVLFARADVKEEEDVLAALAKLEQEWPGRKVGGVVHCGGVGMDGKVSELGAAA